MNDIIDASVFLLIFQFWSVSHRFLQKLANQCDDSYSHSLSLTLIYYPFSRFDVAIAEMSRAIGLWRCLLACCYQCMICSAQTFHRMLTTMLSSLSLSFSLLLWHYCLAVRRSLARARVRLFFSVILLLPFLPYFFIHFIFRSRFDSTQCWECSAYNHFIVGRRWVHIANIALLAVRVLCAISLHVIRNIWEQKKNIFGPTA